VQRLARKAGRKIGNRQNNKHKAAYNFASVYFVSHAWKQAKIQKEWERALMINVYKVKKTGKYATITEEFPYYLLHQKYKHNF
jgi:hypothetical protein